MRNVRESTYLLGNTNGREGVTISFDSFDSIKRERRPAERY